MSSQRIAIVSAYCYPRLTPRAHRATELAKELARQGHDVTLYAVLGGYDYSLFESETGIKVLDLGVSGFEWRTSQGDRKISLWRKGVIFFLRYLFCFPDILIGIRVARLFQKVHGYDRIITIAVPHSVHWGMAYAVKHNPELKNARWVADCGDPFMGNQHGTPPFYFQYVEKWWCRATDIIAVPTEKAIQGYYPEFESKIRIIPQGFVFDDSLLAEYSKNSKPTFAYSGMVYPKKRDPRAFLDYLVTFNEDFLFVVFTNKAALFEPYFDSLKGKIVIRDYVPHNQLIYELSKMDFLINIRNESSVQVPSKLIDYYLTHRPILEIGSDFKEKSMFDAFIHEDYSCRVIIDHPEQYNIINVAKAFLEL